MWTPGGRGEGASVGYTVSWLRLNPLMLLKIDAV